MRRRLTDVQKLADEIGYGIDVIKSSRLETPWGWRSTRYTVVDYNGYGGGYYENLELVVAELDSIKEYITKFGLPSQEELERIGVKRK